MPVFHTQVFFTHLCGHFFRSLNPRSSKPSICICSGILKSFCFPYTCPLVCLIHLHCCLESLWFLISLQRQQGTPTTLNQEEFVLTVPFSYLLWLVWVAELGGLSDWELEINKFGGRNLEWKLIYNGLINCWATEKKNCWTMSWGNCVKKKYLWWVFNYFAPSGDR